MDDSGPTPRDEEPTRDRWWQQMTGYHWRVLLVVTLGWLLDSVDQRLFVLARTPALCDLLPEATDGQVTAYAGYATAVFLLGWATGGLVFGPYADRWGRARTIMISILLYSLCTGLSALAVGWWDFALYRFLCGVGVGGDYAAGMTFVAEVMPDRARPYCLGLLQGLAGLGQVAGSAISLMIGPQADLAGVPGWRLLFAVGVFPVVMVAVIRRTLHEPPSWLRAKQQADDQGPDEVHTRLGDLGDIFRDRRWRYHALIGMTLGVVGQLGTWGIAFWTPELIRGALRETRTLEAGDVQGRPTGAVARSSNRATGATAGLHLRQDPGDQGFHTVRGKEPHAQPRRWKAEEDRLVARGTLLLDLAGILGIYTFTLVTARVGRRWTFAGAFLLAASATVWTFAQLRQPADVYWMVLLLGFGVSSVFGGYAIYFPELFPTRLRSTGTGFCYNVARYLTALGPLTLGRLTLLYASLGHALPLRPAAISLASVYLIGLLALPFAPETRGRPLPE